MGEQTSMHAHTAKEDAIPGIRELVSIGAVPAPRPIVLLSIPTVLCSASGGKVSGLPLSAVKIYLFTHF